MLDRIYCGTLHCFLSIRNRYLGIITQAHNEDPSIVLTLVPYNEGTLLYMSEF